MRRRHRLRHHGPAAFVNELIRTLPTSAPRVVPADVVATGATLIRAVFPADQVPGIVAAYMVGIKVALATTVGGAGAGLLISLCSRWQRLDAAAAAAAAKDAPVAA